MFGAIYIGMSGLTAYSRGLQQVSNNVTNLNTSGFRGSIVSFENFYSSGNGQSGYAPDDRGTGGGIGLGESRLDMRAGELRQTNRDLDLAIDGSGFLVLLDGDQTFYTRTGSFEVDKEGFIVQSGTDRRLATLDSANRPVALSIDPKRTNPPKPTTTIKLASNLSLGSTTHTLTDIAVYDASGAKHVWTITFTRQTGAGNQWNVKVTDDKKGAIGEQLLKFMVGDQVDPQTGLLLYKIEDADHPETNVSVTLDFSQNVSSFSGGTTSTLRVASVDGQAIGSVTSMRVNDKGELELGYSNDQKETMGAVALADFRDPQALQQRSEGLFVYDGTDREFLASEDPRVGKVMSGRIEASNVDLSQQFGELILIQRGFQASSQIVSVSNDMIQQLFGIRGQG